MHRYNNTPMCRRKLRKPCLKLHVYGECKNKQHKYMVKCLYVHGENANDTIGQFGGGGASPDTWRKLFPLSRVTPRPVHLQMRGES